MTRDSSPLCPACCEPAGVLVDVRRLACVLCAFGWFATFGEARDAEGVEAWHRRRVVHLMAHEIDRPCASPGCGTTLATDRGSP